MSCYNAIRRRLLDVGVVTCVTVVGKEEVRKAAREHYDLRAR